MSQTTPMTGFDHRALRIGDWRVDPAIDEISRGGKTIKLESRTMRVLACLAEHAGQVVTVDQLLDTVWKDVVVTPDSVYQAVAALRKALGDDTKEPVYIANVVRRGYRLVAPVTPWVELHPIHSQACASASPAASRDSPMLTISSPRARSSARWPWIALAISLAAGAAFLVESLLGYHERQSGSHGADLATPGLRAQSVAVLPFLDMSDTKDQQYFADGLTEELIERLASVPRLHVVARSSSFYFQGKQATVKEIARTLGVAYLLEGSVRKAGHGIRITTHMVRADDGSALWSKTYDQPLADIFNVQDDIASAVVQMLKISIVPAEPILTSNPEAYTGVSTRVGTRRQRLCERLRDRGDAAACGTAPRSAIRRSLGPSRDGEFLLAAIAQNLRRMAKSWHPPPSDPALAAT